MHFITKEINKEKQLELERTDLKKRRIKRYCREW